jgi:uncharacterized protein YwqG
MEYLSFSGAENSRENMKSLIHQTKAALQKYKRDAFIPIVENGDGSLTDSKFGGTPYMREEDKWSICECGYPTEFVVQINLDTLPFNKGEYGTGLFQMWKCPIDCGSSKIVRIIVPNGSGVKVTIPDINNWQYEIGIRTLSDRHSLQCIEFGGLFMPEVKILRPDINKLINEYRTRHTEPHFPAKRIISWVREDDYPDFEEIEEEDLEEEIWEKHEEYNCWEYGKRGEKMGGWTYWYDKISVYYKYPKCPICEEEMTTLLLQIDHDSNIHLWNIYYGEGTVNIYQCRQHKQQVEYILFTT